MKAKETTTVNLDPKIRDKAKVYAIKYHIKGGLSGLIEQALSFWISRPPKNRIINTKFGQRPIVRTEKKC